MYDELIKWLRGHAKLIEEYNASGKKFCEAADAIEELQGELQALKDDTDMTIVEDGKTTKLCFTKKMDSCYGAVARRQAESSCDQPT